MAVKLYMDAHIPKAITNGLRLRGVDVLTAQEDNTDKFPDPELLDRATALTRVLFTFDDDLLIEAAKRQQSAIPFFRGNFCVSFKNFNRSLYQGPGNDRKGWRT